MIIVGGHTSPDSNNYQNISLSRALDLKTIVCGHPFACQEYINGNLCLCCKKCRRKIEF